MANNNARLRRLAEASPIKDCTLPVIICNEDFLICFANDSAKDISDEFSPGRSILSVIPELNTELFCDATVRGVSLPFRLCGTDSCAAVTKCSSGKTPYYAVVICTFPVPPPQPIPWYVQKNYSYLADSIERLMSHRNKNARALVGFEAQLSRFCKYLFGHCSQISADTDLNELINTVIDAVTPMLSTKGISAELVREDNVFTALDGALAPAGDLTVAMIIALSLFSGAGRIRIMREQVEKTDLVEVSVRTAASKEARERIQTFGNLIFCAEPICVELAAMKDRADACGICFSMRYDGDDMVLYFRAKGHVLSNRVEFNSPLQSRDAMRHFTKLSAELFELAKTSYKRKI